MPCSMVTPRLNKRRFYARKSIYRKMTLSIRPQWRKDRDYPVVLHLIAIAPLHGHKKSHSNPNIPAKLTSVFF